MLQHPSAMHSRLVMRIAYTAVFGRRYSVFATVPDAKGGLPQRQRPKYRARLRLWRLTKNFQRTLQLRASNEAELQLAFDIQVTSAQSWN